MRFSLPPFDCAQGGVRLRCYLLERLRAGINLIYGRIGKTDEFEKDAGEPEVDWVGIWNYGCNEFVLLVAGRESG